MAKHKIVTGRSIKDRGTCNKTIEIYTKRLDGSIRPSLPLWFFAAILDKEQKDLKYTILVDEYIWMGYLDRAVLGNKVVSNYRVETVESEDNTIKTMLELISTLDFYRYKEGIGQRMLRLLENIVEEYIFN